MHYKNIFPYIIIGITMFSITKDTTGQSGKMSKWVVEMNSTLRVQGKTNINTFICNNNEYAKKDTISCISDPSKSLSFTGEIQLDILSFNCHSKMITKDFRKTLKYDEYPIITIKFISLQYMPLLQNEIKLINGLVEVQLASVVKRFELNYSFLQSGSTYLQLNGARSFRFSDFKLTPPRKFGGLIRIKDDFDVNFQLILRTI